MVFVSDISLRKQYESSLQKSKEQFHILVEGVKDYAIFMLDADGLVLNWNAGAERLKGCGDRRLRFPECSRLLGPIVAGTTVPDGVRVPGTAFCLDPVKGAFYIGTMIRWLDYNATWLAAKWGHPSDNLGGTARVCAPTARPPRPGRASRGPPAMPPAGGSGWRLCPCRGSRAIPPLFPPGDGAFTMSPSGGSVSACRAPMAPT